MILSHPKQPEKWGLYVTPCRLCTTVRQCPGCGYNAERGLCPDGHSPLLLREIQFRGEVVATFTDPQPGTVAYLVGLVDSYNDSGRTWRRPEAHLGDYSAAERAARSATQPLQASVQRGQMSPAQYRAAMAAQRRLQTTARAACRKSQQQQH
jgi:hypothetical protein